MADWFPLHCHTHFSLLDGLSKPEQVAARLAECGHAGSAVTDHGTVSGCPSFQKALAKKGLKAILGCEFYLCRHDATLRTPENGALHHLCVLAKGPRGWRNLMRASSASHLREHSYRKPRLDLERLASFAGGEFIVFSGHMGSDLADQCFAEPKLAYRAGSYAEARALVHPAWKDRVSAAVARHRALFGADNFYLEIQRVDWQNLPAAQVVVNILRWAARRLDCPTVATADSHYPRREDAADQRLLLCTATGTTLEHVRRKLDAGEDVGLGAFFKSDNYHIPSREEMNELHGDHPEELANTLAVAARCESYALGRAPLLPAFACPGGAAPDDHLRELCRSGWEEKIAPAVPRRDWPAYHARLWDQELPVLTGAGLSSYFLIVRDLLRFAVEELHCKVGKGRGSAAGSLVAYLAGITRVDPLRHGLLFERFYNAGRNAPGRVALPDIDSDLPVWARGPAFEYLRARYGPDRVCQMATFGRMQGRGALKDVLRAHGRPFEEVNRITEHVPQEAAIADQLQEMREETGEASIIRWALENNPGPLREWAFQKEDGTLGGPLAKYFEQAIRLEGTRRSLGKHASGVVVCSEPLADVAPLVTDRATGEPMVGVDMNDAEALGLVKFDVLGLRTLDCVMGAEAVIRTGGLA